MNNRFYNYYNSRIIHTILVYVHLFFLPTVLFSESLPYAIRSADAAGIEQALKAGGKPNDLDAAGNSPLYHAVVTRKVQFVEMLLKAGANPSINGQAKEPLWAASVNGDIDIITILLKNGADPEAGESPLRPIDAAILSGRGEVLRKLIESKSKSSLPYEFPADSSKFSMISDMVDLGITNFVDDAMVQNHFKMAELLLREGSINGLKKNRLNDLLLRAVSLDPVQMELIDLLLQSGADPIEKADTRWKFSAEYLTPETGLEIAAIMGRADLVKRLAIRNIGQIQANRLLTLALNSGDDATIAAVRLLVPRAQPYYPERRPAQSTYLIGPEVSPRHSWDTRASAAILLKPRVTAPQPIVMTPNSKMRVAVIGDAHSGSEAILLAAKLSMVEGITVLDREDIAAVIRERNFDFETKSGLTQVADLLSAQVLVMIGKPGTKNDVVLRAEVVDVQTGLITHRIHTEAAKLNTEPWVASITSAIRRSKERIKSADGLHAVTLLGVGTIKGERGADTIRSLVSAALMAEVDATSGCVALTRLQMKHLIDEQAMGGKGSLWKAGWAIEAGASVLAEKKIELRFRLRDLNSNDSFDSTIQGETEQVDSLVAQAWTQLITKSRIGKVGGRMTNTPNAEPMVLLEEANWRFKNGEYEAAAQLADAVCVMNGTDADAQFLRISARVCGLLPSFDDARFHNSTWVGETVLYDMDGWLEVIALMQENFDEVFVTDARRYQVLRAQGGARPEHGCINWLRTMIRLRAATPDWALRTEDKDALAEFDREFESWCRRLLKKCYEDQTSGDVMLNSAEMAKLLETHGLSKMPWLASVTMELLAKRNNKIKGKHWEQSMNFGIMYQAINALSRQNKDFTIIYEIVSNHLDETDGLLMRAFRQDSEYILASDSYKVRLAEAITARISEDLRTGKNVTANLLPIPQLARYRLIERREFNVLPLTSSDLLYPVPASGVPEEELLRNLGLYRALSSTDLKLVAENLLKTAMIVNQNEMAAGTARIRGRVSSAIRYLGLDDPRLNDFINSLPPDLPLDNKKATNTQAVGIGHVTLKNMPEGANFFMVTQVLPDSHRGVIWWVGGFLRNKVNCALSNEEIIPGLVRVDPVTGDVAYAVTSELWLNVKSINNKWINPDAMSVLANEKVVIWHVASNGVYHVDATTMKYENLIPSIGPMPLSIQGGANATALVGDAVFVIEKRSSQYNELKGYHEINFERVLRLRRGEDPVVVVETGRRPKVTELDTEGTKLTMVASHEGKFRIIANSEPAFLKLGIKMVDFDFNGSPVKDSLVTDQNKIERNFMKAGMEKYSVLVYRKSWPLKNGGQIFSGTKPGVLELGRNGKIVPVQIKLPIPEGIDATFWADKFNEYGQKTNERGDFSISDFASTHCAPVIVYQDGDTLGVMIQWRGSIRGLFPVIWHVKESELLRQIDK